MQSHSRADFDQDIVVNLRDFLTFLVVEDLISPHMNHGCSTCPHFTHHLFGNRFGRRFVFHSHDRLELPVRDEFLYLIQNLVILAVRNKDAVAAVSRSGSLAGFIALPDYLGWVADPGGLVVRRNV